MHFWILVQSTPAEQFVPLARELEALGYDGVNMPDHVVISVGDRTPHPTGYPLAADEEFPDPLCVYSAMAAATTRLRFLTNVYVVPMRNVMMLAKQIGTLAWLSDNRFVLGTGVGWLPEEFAAIGEEFDTRGHRMDEMLDILRDFWDDGYAEYHGRFFDFPRSGMFPVPTEPVPIWIGGHSARAAQRAIRFDGYMPMDGLNERVRGEFAAIDRARAELGLDGPYERVVLAPRVTDPGELRRMHEEDGITGVMVSPQHAYGEFGIVTDLDKRLDFAKRYAEEFMAPLR